MPVRLRAKISMDISPLAPSNRPQTERRLTTLKWSDRRAVRTICDLD